MKADLVFEGRVVPGHKEHAVEVPFDPATRWGTATVVIRPGRRGHRVRAVVDNVAFDSFIVARSKRHWLLLEQTILTKIGGKAGDTITVRVVPV